ncbi:FemAB family XrtA/PEP-CTERM system-associated protein [Sphingomonas sp. 1P06PA]|uniref:FemAB family XrtA/PEP-CTERM system-associated protein n=1 Tax=Sphingomonas sp. 1P06PA TaxID=554121 RepID=UPI0039A45462
MDHPVASATIRAARLNDPAECAAIDAYVRAAAGATPFHLTAWQLGVAEGCGQHAHCLTAERGGAIVGLLPLTEVHSPLFGRALVSTGFAVGGGVLADDPLLVEPLAEAGWALAETLSCPTLELRGGALPAGWARDDTSYLGFARPLAADDEAELLAIPRKQRAEVRRALGFDLDVAIGRDAAALRDHHAIYAASVHNLGTPVFPPTLFARVLDRFGADADILTVAREGVPLASVLSLYFRGTVYPYWGGGTAGARTWRANDLMYFALMRHARARGCTRFDFGRSKTGTGAAAFKRNWGFGGVPLAYAARAAGGREPRRINPLDPKYSAKVAAWRRLPLAVANRIGPLIARGLG